MVLVQVDLPKEIGKRLKITMAEQEIRNKPEAIIRILSEYYGKKDR